MNLSRQWLRADLPLLAFVALVPACVLSGHPFSYHDAARLAQLGVLVLTGVALLGSVIASPSVPSRTLPWPVIAAVALGAASVAASAVPAQAVRELALMMGLAGAVVAAMDGFGADALHRARWAVLIGAGTQALVMLLFVILGLTGGQPFSWQELSIGYDNYRILNHTQTIALPLLALLAGRERPRSAAWLVAWGCLLVHMMFVWCSGARGTTLALVAAGALGMAALGARAAWPACRTLLLAGLGGAVLYGVSFIALPAMGVFPLSTSAERSIASLASDSARLQLWSIAVDEITSAPWLGVGPMHYAHYPNSKAAHPHNLYLQLAAEWGLPMLVLVLGLITAGLVRMARVVRAEADAASKQEGGALFVACLAILFDATVSGNLVMPVSQMWIALCVAWSVAWVRAASGKAPLALAGVRGGRVIAAIILASQAWLVLSVWPEAAALRAHLDQVKHELVDNPRTNPRFWSHGWF